MGIFGSNRGGQPRYSGELHNLQITQSVFGTTAPIIIGTRRVALKLLFYGGFYKTNAPNQGGKGLGGGKGDQQYDYYADLIGALASGSATEGCRGILDVWDQQGKLWNESSAYEYTIPAGGGSVTPAASGAAPIQMDLGVSKAVSYSVEANDFGAGGPRTLTGTQQVAMQPVGGAPGAGQYNYNSSTRTYAFSAADAGTTVTISYSSVWSLYYFEQTQAAMVPLESPYRISTNNQQYFLTDHGVVRVDTGAALVAGTDYTESDGVYSFSAALAGVYVYITYTYTSSDSSITNTSTLNLTFFAGTLGQTPWSYMQSKYPGSAFGYTGICYIGANPMALGESASLPSYNYEVVGLCIFPGGGLDAHPCDALKLLLADAFLGVGFPSACIGDWTDAYAYWAANNYLISKCLDTQTSVTDALSQVIEVGNVGAVWSDGVLKLIPYGDTTCVGNGYTYTPNTSVAAKLTWLDLLPPSDEKAGRSTSDEPLQVSKRAPQDCWNYVEAEYCDRENDYNNAPINEQNDAFIASYGRRIESMQTWDWIASAATATWALKLRLNRQCYIRNTYKFWLSFRFSYLEPMDLVEAPTGEVVRITQIEDAADGKRSIEAEEWDYGTGNVTIYPKQQPNSFQPNLSSALPGDAVPIVVQGTSALSGGTPYTLQIAATGQNQNWGGANIYVSLDGLSYTLLDAVDAPSVIGILSAPLPNATDPDLTDTLSVDLSLSQSNSELLSVTQLLADKMATLCAIVDPGSNATELVSYETATLTATARYNLNYLRRGGYGSSPSAHAVGSWFAFLGPQYKFASYQFSPNLAGQTLYIKLQSFNLVGKQLQDLSTCPAWQFVLGTQPAGQTTSYFPSQVTQSSSGTASISNAGGAYDGRFTDPAVFDAGDAGGDTGSVAASYSGFPALTLAKPAVLYVNYQNLQGVLDPGNEYHPQRVASGSSASVTVQTPGGTYPLVASPTVETLNASWPNGSQAQGTATVNLPAGTDLSQIKVVVAADCSVMAGSYNGGPGHVEIVQIWVQ